MNLRDLRQKLDKRDPNHPDPEWTAEIINRKHDSTTFKQCGWCKHTGGGSCRYDCMLSTNCSLLRDYGLGSHVYWDTPCLIKMLGKEDMNKVIKYKEYSIKEDQRSIKRLEDDIKIIRKMELSIKPPLPDNRLHDYEEGEIVWAYSEKEKKWRRGTVVPGYRSHNGCVSYILDGVPKSRPRPEGEGPWGCGVGISGILKDWEYQYFKKHIEDFEIWLHLSDREYNGERMNIDDMFVALKNNKGKP